MNIYDIARMANVSIATVSRVVNDSPRVSDKTKQKVRAVMEENNYIPNVFARGLGLDSMKTIGILCPDISDDYMSLALSHLEKRLRDFGYDCILYCSGYKLSEKEKSMNLILSKRPDALILVGSTYAGTGNNKSEVKYIKEAAKQLPVFIINGYVRAKNVYCVLFDDYKMVYQMTAKLINQGRKKILFFYNANSYSSRQKMAGYEDALKDNGVTEDASLLMYCKNDIYTAKDFLIQLKETAFDAVIAAEDGLAVGAVKYAQEKKIAIPEELSVIGYNNSKLSMACNPELTSVDTRLEELCTITVNNLMALLREDKKVLHKVQLQGAYIKRQTTNF